MPRGGARNGTPGQSYSNRTDLNTGSKPLPPTAVPGQPYGQAGAQMAAQKALPMQGTPSPAMPGQPGVPDPIAQQQSPQVFLGDHGDPLRPTERPHEPVTTGLAVGAGPGPEVLPSTPSSAQNVSQFLQSLAQRPGAPADIVALASLAQSRG